MKKTYMTPAISVMAMETAAILADSNFKTTLTGARPKSDDSGISDPSLNQFSKDYTFEDWDEELQ